jgi:hypothetical protein
MFIITGCSANSDSFNERRPLIHLARLEAGLAIYSLLEIHLPSNNLSSAIINTFRKEEATWHIYREYDCGSARKRLAAPIGMRAESSQSH